MEKDYLGYALRSSVAAEILEYFSIRGIEQ